ncbi:MAG TPA: hypothetical protein VK963_00315 [Candidatus Saccharimonadales bacterium]|nr:hypothetical protein [Candidatus Saccharimonadales bacterium]
MDSTPTHLANAEAITRWAEENVSARTEFPRLIRRLIDQTNDQVSVNEMRAGKGAGTPGYDGRVETGRATPFVPEGRSVWELGTGGDPLKKANDDYYNRTTKPLDEDLSDKTFVFVSSRRWPDKDKWVKRKKAKNCPWRDVLAFDIDNIDQALEKAPAAHYWISEVIGLPVGGIQTLERWWEQYSGCTSPGLTPELVIGGRADQAAHLLRILDQERQITTIASSNTDEILAFVAAVIKTSPQDQRTLLMSRALIVKDALSLRRLDSTSELIILLPYEDELRREAQLITNHHVIFLAHGDGDADIELPPVDFDAFQKGLKAAGVADEQRSYELAVAAHTSLQAFQRKAGHKSAPSHPWQIVFESNITRRAWLTGGWSGKRTGDQEIVANILGHPYDQAEDKLAPAKDGADPLFSVVGGTWGIPSMEDSWPFVRRKLTKGDLAAIENAIQTVLAAVDPALELPVEDRWMAAIYGKSRIHSSDLRRGLANVLAFLSAHGSGANLGDGSTAQAWAMVTTGQIFRRAQEDSSGQIWMSLSDVLPLLAEAAPDSFLAAVEAGTRSREPLLAKMFIDQNDGISVNSPHTALLWALETLAWSPDYASFAARMLARLTEIDPGGRLSNRPLASLGSVFRPWLPQTTLSVERRLAVLDDLIKKHQGVAWDLMLELLPESNAVGFPAHSPKFHDWKPEPAPKVLVVDYWQFTDAVFEKLLAIVGDDPGRWEKLLGKVSDLSPEQNQKLRAHLKTLVVSGSSAIPTSVKQQIWSSLSHLVRYHRAFADAKWSLPEEELSKLEALAERFKSDEPIKLNRWLFDDHLPDLGTKRIDSPTYNEDLRKARTAATAEMYRAGLDEVLKVAKTCQVPWAFGYSVADAGITTDEDRIIKLLSIPDNHLVEFARAYTVYRLKQGQGIGQENKDWLNEKLKVLDGDPLAQARLLLGSDDLAATWKRAVELGPGAERLYWDEFLPYGRGGDFAYVKESAQQLFDHDRPLTALALLDLYYYNEKSPDAQIIELTAIGLERLVHLPEGHKEQTGIPEAYRIQHLLDCLRQGNLDEDRLGTLEWQLLPARGHQEHSPILERRLARDPKFFIDILSLCYRPDNGPMEQEVPERVSRNAYRLLGEWKTIPGRKNDAGDIDEKVLIAWIEAVRKLAAERHRSDVCDIHIGHVLAYAREDADETWPTTPVRNAIEQIASEKIEQGFFTETYNKRGVVTRNPYEGGGLEWGLARKYKAWAAKIADQWPRTAALLRAHSESYEAEARREDERAERHRRGLED